MEFLLRIVGALLFAYFASRIILRLPNPGRGIFGLILAHAVSLGIISVMVVMMRAPLDVFQVKQLLIFVLAQGAWFAYDLLRGTYPQPIQRS